MTLATIENQEIETPLSQKELVGGMHDFLSLKVTGIECDIFLVLWMWRPLCNLNPFGFCFVLLKCPVN
jgi:hypothetical protein